MPTSPKEKARCASTRARWKSQPRLDGTQLTDLEAARLRSRIKINPVTGCHEWTGSVDNDGYPQIVWKGKRYRVHKLWNEYETDTPVPGGLTIDHTCENKTCCNSAHHDRVTGAENSRRAAQRRRARQRRLFRDLALLDQHLDDISREAA